MKRYIVKAVSLAATLSMFSHAAQADDLVHASLRDAWSGSGRMISVGDRLEDLPSSAGPNLPRLTEKEAGNSITANLRKRFDAAADPSTHLMTKDAASRTGWGWAVDHFADMDPQGKGAIRFEDVLRYVGRRSVVKLPGA